MNFINYLTETPLWIWAVLAFFVDVGLKSMHQHVVYLPRLFLLPAVMIFLKYQDFSETMTIMMYTIFFMLLGTWISILFARRLVVHFHPKAWTVQLPGSYVTFMFLVIFFSIKFLFGYLHVVQDVSMQPYFLIDIIISALFTGYFLGRACFFVYVFYVNKYA